MGQTCVSNTDYREKVKVEKHSFYGNVVFYRDFTYPDAIPNTHLLFLISFEKEEYNKTSS